MNSRILIYIIEDDAALNKLLVSHLKNNGFKNVKGFLTGEEFLIDLKKFPDIIIQDYDLPGMNGVSILKKVKLSNPKTEFIFVSGQESVEIAVDAMKYGAYDYIIKDSFTKEKILLKINNIINLKKLARGKVFNRFAVILFALLLILSWIIFFYLDSKGIV